jgi:hypothetical protein
MIRHSPDAASDDDQYIAGASDCLKRGAGSVATRRLARSRAARAAGFSEWHYFFDFSLQEAEARVKDELSLIEARLKCADGKRSFSVSRGEPKR